MGVHDESETKREERIRYLFASTSFELPGVWALA